MDAKNLFETRTTSRLVRAEYGLGLAVAAGYFFAHLDEVRWLPAVVLFVYIDVVGYLPGALAHHRAKGGDIHRAYYVLYNVMHSLVTQGLLVLAWIWWWGPEWALLALPIHLFGDRALFGNYLKPFGLPFEPVAHPTYLRLQDDVAAATRPPRQPIPAPSGDRVSGDHAPSGPDHPDPNSALAKGSTSS